MRQPNPERGLFMDIQKKKFMNIYGFIDGHFWPKKTKTFMSEKTKTFLTKKKDIYVEKTH